MKRLFLLGLGVLLSGCATNPFSQFYYDRTGGADLTTSQAVISPAGDPLVFRGNDVEKDAVGMIEKGYALIGYSSFNGGNVDENDALSQARKVHAAAIIIYGQYTDTESGSTPVVLPGYQAWPYASRTIYVPYNVRRYDYLVTYWVKLKPPVFGCFAVDLSPELRSQIKSNKGVLVMAVLKDSPAFREDILKGDVIKRV